MKKIVSLILIYAILMMSGWALAYTKNRLDFKFRTGFGITGTPSTALLLESGFYILQENGDKILLE